MNKKLYIIAGAPNMRKSSVIRALTGVRDTRTFTLQFEIDRVNTHVMVTSPNEISSNVFPNGIGIHSLIELLSNLNETAIILPLSSIASRFNLPLASKVGGLYYSGKNQVNTTSDFFPKAEV